MVKNEEGEGKEGEGKEEGARSSWPQTPPLTEEKVIFSMRQGRNLGLGGMEFSLLAVGRGLGHRLKLWTGLQNGIKGPAELAAPPDLTPQCCK